MNWRFLAGLYGLSAIGFGAFGAHALRERLSPEMMAAYQTGAHYHLVHAAALLALSYGAPRGRALYQSSALLAAGVLLFSGSLYALALTSIRAIGAVTPVGGVLMLAGWSHIAISALRKTTAPPS